MAAEPRIVFVREAELEFEEARLWYERQQPGLGNRFGVAIDEALERIRQSPLMYARVNKDYRRVLVDHFPFTIYYEYDADLITVYSVFHGSRDPANLDRLLP